MFIQRLLSAIILIPIAVGAAYAGGLWFFALIVLIASMAGYEYYEGASSRVGWPRIG